MTVTKPEMWIVVIAFVTMFAISISLLGNDLRNSDITLDNKSLEYIDEYDASIQQNNLDEYSDNSTLSQKEKNPIVDFASNLPIVSDVLGGINFFIDKTKQVLSYLALIYNLPSFFIEGFGLDVGAFKHIINILSAMFLIAVTIIAVRLVK